MFINIQLRQCADIDFKFILIRKRLCQTRIQTVNPFYHQHIAWAQSFRRTGEVFMPCFKIKDRKHNLSPFQKIFHLGVEQGGIYCFQTFKIVLTLGVLWRIFPLHEIIIYCNGMGRHAYCPKLNRQPV